MTSAGNSLRLVKIAHTIVWAIFAACVVAIPVLARLGHDRQASALILVVLVEVLVLIANHGHLSHRSGSHFRSVDGVASLGSAAETSAVWLENRLPSYRLRLT